METKREIAQEIAKQIMTLISPGHKPDAFIVDNEVWVKFKIDDGESAWFLGVIELNENLEAVSKKVWLHGFNLFKPKPILKWPSAPAVFNEMLDIANQTTHSFNSSKIRA